MNDVVQFRFMTFRHLFLLYVGEANFASNARDDKLITDSINE